MTQLATLSCNLVTQKIQTTQKTMHNQTLQKWATLSNTVTRYSLSQTLMSDASQYIASKGFRYNYYICRWWLRGRVRHNFWEIWRGVRANLLLLRGEVLCNIYPCETHFSGPLLIIIAQSLILWYFRPLHDVNLAINLTQAKKSVSVYFITYFTVIQTKTFNFFSRSVDRPWCTTVRTMVRTMAILVNETWLFRRSGSQKTNQIALTFFGSNQVRHEDQEESNEIYNGIIHRKLAALSRRYLSKLSTKVESLVYVTGEGLAFYS